MTQTGTGAASEIGRRLSALGKTLAVAESCTAGLVGHSISTEPGCSAYFLGGVIAYADRVKTAVLAVDPVSLRDYGAVSEVVARQMAAGVRRLLRADIGLGVTGIAGPSGGSDAKPVGLVFVSCADESGITCKRLELAGDRSTVQASACDAVLEMVIDRLGGNVTAGRPPGS